MEENRLKLVRENLGGITQPKLADILELPLHKIRDAEAGKTKISIEIAEALEEKLKYSFKWALTGKGDMFAVGSQAGTGNGFLHGHKIEAEAIHIYGGVAHDQESVYSDPIQEAFLKDWLMLNDVRKMRVWTYLKEELEKEKEGK